MLNFSLQNAWHEAKLPARLCGASKGRFELFIVAGIALLLSIVLVILVQTYQPHFLNLLITMGVLLFLVSAPLFFWLEQMPC
ncbi:MAG: hypothetical protein WC712_05720 [Candidatus Brocadiia bacterium]